MSGYAHQDWTPVVLRKKPMSAQDMHNTKILNQALRNGEVSTVARTAAGKNDLPLSVHKLEDNEREDFHHKTVPSETKTAIVQARVAKKWSQDEFARQMNEPVRTVKDYESGKAIPTPQVLNKMSRVLGVKLKR